MSTLSKKNILTKVKYICMPIFLACISFVLLYVVANITVGDPAFILYTLKEVTGGDSDIDMATLYDVYDDTLYNSTHDKNGNLIRDSIMSISGTDTVSISEYDIVLPGYNTIYGVLEVPKIKFRHKLIFGDSTSALTAGVGQYSGSFVPGYGGTALVSAHNNKIRRAEELSAGDEIIITTSYGVYIYRITSTKITISTDSTAYKISHDDNSLIFYTCYPLYRPSNASQRLFIYAELVSGPRLTE